jgi:hypothetical protein
MPLGKSILFIPLIAALLISCSAGKEDKGEEVASVNGAPIYMQEFMKEVKTISRREPGVKLTEERLEEILHTMVDKKLLIDEAVKAGLSQDEHFLESIKSFWEQTLIRELIDKKNRSGDKLIVTDDEVRQRHSLMQSKITLRVIKTHDMKAAEAALSELPVRGSLMGPLFIEDIRPMDPLFAAFGKEAGERGTAGSGDDFFAYEVVKKEPSGAPPIESVYEALRTSLLEEKKERALEDWLEARKKAAAIKVYEDAIERLE